MILKNIHRNKLHQELFDAGVEPISVFAIDDSDFGAEMNFAEDTDMDLVQQTIGAHDPTPLPPPKTQLEILQEAVDTLILDSLGVL